MTWLPRSIVSCMWGRIPKCFSGESPAEYPPKSGAGRGSRQKTMTVGRPKKPGYDTRITPTSLVPSSRTNLYRPSSVAESSVADGDQMSRCAVCCMFHWVYHIIVAEKRSLAFAQYVRVYSGPITSTMYGSIILVPSHLFEFLPSPCLGPPLF